MPVRGSALSAKGSPLTVYSCHCKDCQRFSGAAWSVSMIMRDEDFEVLSGQTVRYDRKPTAAMSSP